MENRNILIGLGTGLAAGLVLGYGAGVYFSTTAPHDHPQAPLAAPAMAVDPAAQNQVEAFARITATRAALARDPNNVAAWVALGNDCFDTHQPQAAVDAYAKALALSPDHPKAADILTDQGVMYREMKAFDKALANFKQANKLNPTHLPSLLNMVVVYTVDLHDKADAKRALDKLLQVAPTSSQAEQAKQILAAN